MFDGSQMRIGNFLVHVKEVKIHPALCNPLLSTDPDSALLLLTIKEIFLVHAQRDRDQAGRLFKWNVIRAKDAY